MVSFFQDMLDVTAINTICCPADISKQGNVLKIKQTIELCKLFTKAGVESILLAIANSKFLRLDGRSTFFLKFFWNDIGGIVREIMLDFFFGVFCRV